MSATNCKVGVLAQETLAADIRRLTVAWTDPRPEYRPRAGQFFMLRSWSASRVSFATRSTSSKGALTMSPDSSVVTL